GPGAAQAAATAWMASASRRPPLASLRSGSSRKASSPLRAVRSLCSACSSASRVPAAARQSASAPLRSSPVSPGSPATCRACSRPGASGRGRRATSRASAGRRTAWSRRVPESQIGYQIRSASAAIPCRAVCRSSTSRSLPGTSSRRPYPPTATRATPGSPPSSEASHRSALAVRRGRAGPKGASPPAPAGAPPWPPPPPPTRPPPPPPPPAPRPALSGAASHPPAHRSAPALAVADPPRLRGLDYDADQVVGVLVVAEHLKPHLGDQVYLVFRAPVHLGMAALPAVSARLTDR